MRKRMFGEESSRTAESWHALARVSARRPTFVDAEVACRRALAIREKTLGPDHLLTASTWNLLGAIDVGLGRNVALNKSALLQYAGSSENT